MKSTKIISILLTLIILLETLIPSFQNIAYGVEDIIEEVQTQSEEVIENENEEPSEDVSNLELDAVQEEETSKENEVIEEELPKKQAKTEEEIKPEEEPKEEPKEEEKKEEVKSQPEEPTITVSRGDMGSFRIAGEWIDPTVTNYTYATYTTTHGEPIYVDVNNNFRL